VRLVTLSDYEHTTAIAAKTGYIKEEDLEVLKEWRKSPSTWKQ
jgi:orotate phosphoribosyltransferase